MLYCELILLWNRTWRRARVILRVHKLPRHLCGSAGAPSVLKHLAGCQKLLPGRQKWLTGCRTRLVSYQMQRGIVATDIRKNLRQAAGRARNKEKWPRFFTLTWKPCKYRLVVLHQSLIMVERDRREGEGGGRRGEGCICTVHISM